MSAVPPRKTRRTPRRANLLFGTAESGLIPTVATKKVRLTGTYVALVAASSTGFPVEGKYPLVLVTRGDWEVIGRAMGWL